MLAVFELIDIDASQIMYHLVTMAAAFVLALPIGWNRQRSESNMGFRTFPLPWALGPMISKVEKRSNDVAFRAFQHVRSLEHSTHSATGRRSR